MCGILDFAAARAGEVAAKQRLEHQHERILLAAFQFLADDVTRHRPHLRYRSRYAHRRLAHGPFDCEASIIPGSMPPVNPGFPRGVLKEAGSAEGSENTIPPQGRRRIAETGGWG